MAQEIWAAVAVTLVGAYGAAALNLAARRWRESDTAKGLPLSVISIVVSVATLLADVVLLVSARLYWFAWGLAAVAILAYGAVGVVVLVALRRRRLCRGAGGGGAGPST